MGITFHYPLLRLVIGNKANLLLGNTFIRSIKTHHSKNWVFPGLPSCHAVNGGHVILHGLQSSRLVAAAANHHLVATLARSQVMGIHEEATLWALGALRLVDMKLLDAEEPLVTLRALELKATVM